MLRPSPSACAEIGDLRDGLDCLSSAVADDRLHLTLAISADHNIHSPPVATMMQAIGERTQAEPVHVVLDEMVASNMSVALRPSRSSPAMRDLAHTLAARLERAGIARPCWRFSPHVTLGYRRQDGFGRRVAPIAWTATDYLLIHSHVGRTRHEILGRWPLAQRQAALDL